MADKPTYYAQFDGDVFDGTRYALGDPIGDISVGTEQYLIGIGRIAANKPAMNIVVPSTDTPLADMDRSQLEATARAEMDLSNASDDQLIAAIEKQRASVSGDAPAADGPDLTILDGTVPDVTAKLDALDADHLTALRAAEVAGKDRAGALTAIDAAIAAKQPAPTA